MKRILSLLLALTLCLGMLPANGWAEAAEEATEVAEATESLEERQEEALPEEPVPEETEASETEPEEVTEATEAETVETEEAEVVETEALEEPETEETVTLEPVNQVWINPEYEDLFSESDIGTSDISGFEGEAVQCGSLEEVIEALREGLVNREENPTAVLVTTTAYQVSKDTLNDILDRIYDHTGTPTEGDYLRRDIGYIGIGFEGSGSVEDGVITYTYTFTLGSIKYFTTAAQEREMDQKVSQVLASLALDGKTQKGKIDAIYDYLIRNVKYVSDAELADENNVIKYSSYAALVQHNAVCQGFAGAFYRLCLESGIDSRIVSSNAMNHAWNIVELGGSYYHVDATWDINWPDSPKYYLRGTNYWKAEHKSSTTGYVSELGDQFADGDFAAEYPVPTGDYEEILAAATVTVTVVDGAETAERELTVGRQYFSYDLTLRENTRSWDLEAIRITKENDKVTVTRIIRKDDTGDNANVQLDDVKVDLLWDWNTTTIKFYFSYDAYSPLAATMTYHNGEPLENLPQLNGKTVLWYTESGEPLVEGRVYNFSNSTIKAYPRSGTGLVFGDCGENLTWIFAGNSGSLIIYGLGTMYNFNGDEPWAEFKNEIRSLDIQEGVTTIGSGAFYGYENLETVQLSDTVYTIGAYAFADCTGLKGPLVLPEKLIFLGDAAFENCSGLTGSLVIPSDVHEIRKRTFSGCIGLNGELIMYDGLEGIGDWAFYGSNFTGTLNLPATVKTVGYSAFQGCSGITGLNFSDGLETIGAEAFAGCAGIQGELKLPDSVRIVDDYAFYGCKNIRGNAYLSGDLAWVGTGAFSGTRITSFSASEDNITFVSIAGLLFTDDEETLFMVPCGMNGQVEIPAGTRTIASYAFIGCNQITSLRIQDNRLSKFKSDAFDGCDSLTDVYYNGTLAQWQAIQGHEQLDGKNIHCEEQECILLLHSNGGSPDEVIQVPCRNEVIRLPENTFFTRSGYRFVGWSTEEQGRPLSPESDVTALIQHNGIGEFYAQWAPDSYTVSFDPNGGTGSLKDMTAQYEANLTLPKSGFTRTGYSFIGWNTEADGTGSSYTPGQRVSQLTEEESITLYAQWKANTYTVRFNPNKGIGKMPDQKNIPYDEATELSPCTFTRTGYRFVGWNTKANGTGETIEEALKLTAANNGTVTLYAQWEGAPYQVTFHNGEETWTQTLYYGTAGTLDPNTFEKPGYTFKSWNTKENGKGKSYKDGAKVTNLSTEKDVDLYAQWTANKYTVVFHSNAAKDTTKKQTLTYDGKETALTANSFSWKGHTFQGWTTEDGRTFANKEKVRNLTTEKTVDLYASWKVNEYTVVFLPNGAEGEEVTQNMTYDVPAELEANRFERIGYTFRGWATTAKGKAVHTDGKTVKNLTDKDGVTLRLYAVWAPTTYTVTFVPGEGATGTMKPMKMTYGKTYTLTKVGFKRANYTFTGWLNEETWETYANKAKVKDLSADGSTVTLTAQWVPTEYAITYKNLSTWEKEGLLTSYNVLTEGLPGTPSRPGCEFAGWFLDSACKKPFTGFENIAKPGKLTLYPKWIGTPGKYTIHFAPGADGVTGKMADKKNLVCGKDYTLAACAFKRSGYKFVGWEIGGVTLANKAKFSDLPAYLDSFVSGGTVTLTAKWVKIS